MTLTIYRVLTCDYCGKQAIKKTEDLPKGWEGIYHGIHSGLKGKRSALFILGEHHFCCKDHKKAWLTAELVGLHLSINYPIKED